MAERPIPIEWARQSAGETQNPADGSRLIDCYAVNPAALPTVPFQPKVNVTLNPAPVRSAWLNLPDVVNFNFMRGADAIVAPSVINGLTLLDSPVYGRRLVGVCAGWYFFEMVFGGVGFGAAVDGDPPADFNGRGALATLPFNAERFHRYTVEDEETAGSGSVRLASDGRRAMFVVRSQVFVYDSDGRTFRTISAPTPSNQSANLPDEAWIDCAWTDGFFILVAAGGQFFHSLHNSLDFEQLDFASAESSPDGNVAIAVFRRQIFVFGTRSVERWANVGGAAFAFARDNSFNVPIGCPARDTVHSSEFEVFFLGSDNIVYALDTGLPERISHEGVEADLRKSDASGARAFTYTQLGHRFYSLTLSTGLNWTYDATVGFWHERTESRVLSAVQLDHDTLVTSVDSLAIDALGVDPFRAGARITSIAVTPKFFARTTRTRISSLEVQTSVAPGAVPPVGTAKLEVSYDAGTTFEPPNAQTRPIAATMRFNRLGSDRFGLGIQFRLTLDYEPVVGADPLQVLGAYATASAALS